MGDVKARGEFAVDKGDDTGLPLLEVVIVNQVSLAELDRQRPIVPGRGVGLLKADDVGHCEGGSLGRERP